MMSRVAVGAAVKTGSTPASSMTAVTFPGIRARGRGDHDRVLGFEVRELDGRQPVEHLPDVAATAPARRASPRPRPSPRRLGTRRAAASALIAPGQRLRHGSGSFFIVESGVTRTISGFLVARSVTFISPVAGSIELICAAIWRKVPGVDHLGPRWSRHLRCGCRARSPGRRPESRRACSALASSGLAESGE